MSNRKLENMNDTDFEAMLENSISEYPPEDIIAEVTPWKKSIKRVLIGMALNTITLNFFCLNYILPAIGMILLLLGFRTLRHENKWFGSCFVIAVLRSVCFFPALILNTTIYQADFYSSGFTSVLNIVHMLLCFLMFICLWRGFLSVQRKAELTPHAGSGFALVVWYVLVCLLAWIQYSGWLLSIPMIIGYYFIIRNLYKLSKELHEAGYVIQTAPIKISDCCLVLTVSFALLVGISCGYLFGNRYPMEWTPVDSEEHGDAEDIKEQLLRLGFPDYVLNDLTAEDIAACEGAVQVVADVIDEPVNDGRVVVTKQKNGDYIKFFRETVFYVKELRITGVGVQIPGEKERWMIFHHFLWTTNPGFFGTESIQLWPVYRDISEAWVSAGNVTGRVLYDDDGTSFASGYDFLGTKTFTSNSIFFGEQSSTDVFATFSMPQNGQNHRGYIAYPVDELQDGYLVSSWFNYTHQRTWMQYPVMTAMQSRIAYGRNKAGAFMTVQDALQFRPDEKDIELIN